MVSNNIQIPNKTAHQNWQSQTILRICNFYTGWISGFYTQKLRKTADQNWQSQTKAPLQIGKEACTGRPAAKARGGGVMDKLPALVPVIRL